jgi:hypothetical protein
VIVGIDEVGRGAWAGPLMVGAAVLPREKRVNGVRDSKVLTEAGREFCSTGSRRGATPGRSVERPRKNATTWEWPRRNGWRRVVRSPGWA